MCSLNSSRRRRRALHDHHRPHVHVRVLPLLVQEGGIDRAQAVLVSLRHGGSLNAPGDARHNLRRDGSDATARRSPRPPDRPGRDPDRPGGHRQRAVRLRRGRRRDGEAQAAGGVPRASRGAFDSRAAYNSVKRQVALGPRPAGSAASQVLAERLRRALPGGRFQAVPGGLRNVIGRGARQDEARGGGRRPLRHQGHPRLRGRQRRRRGHRGDGAAGAHDQAAEAQADARVHRLRRRGEPRRRVRRRVLRARAARQQGGRPALPERLRDGAAGLHRPARAAAEGRRQRRPPACGRRSAPRAARRASPGCSPPAAQGGVEDDHTPFLRQGVPAVDFIDFDYACFHRSCDNLAQIHEPSLDATGETMMKLLPTL